jgi:hypothetical protein
MLYQLKEKSLGVSNPGLPLSRKLHAALCCIPNFLQKFGTLDKADTTSYESAHRSMTVDIWNLTSKRYETMNEEMSKQSTLHNYSSTNDLISAMAMNKIDSYIREKGPKVYPENVMYENISNYATYILKVDADGNFYCNNKNLDTILTGSSVSCIQLKSLVYDAFGEEAWNDLLRTDNCTTLSIVQGISIEGMS